MGARGRKKDVFWESRQVFASPWLVVRNGSDLKCIGGEGQRLRPLARKVASWARARSEKPALVRFALAGLRAWCDQERGRRALVAKELGLERQVVTNWLAGRQQPTAEQVLHLLEFLNRRR
jgi:hypothetical protein